LRIFQFFWLYSRSSDWVKSCQSNSLSVQLSILLIVFTALSPLPASGESECLSILLIVFIDASAMPALMVQSTAFNSFDCIHRNFNDPGSSRVHYLSILLIVFQASPRTGRVRPLVSFQFFWLYSPSIRETIAFAKLLKSFQFFWLYSLLLRVP